MNNKNLSRRHFIASTAAAGAMASAGPVLAHNNTPYVLPEDYQPIELALMTELAPGEIHVDPATYRLYWTLPDNRAIRYTVGVGRAGLYHDGEFMMKVKKEWPSWTPTPAMIARNAGYARWQNGMPGGINNPLGARALYLFDANGQDTFLRIHGTNAPQTIGTSVSNGCARLTNEHIVELYDRVPVETRVVLHPKGQPAVVVDETMA